MARISVGANFTLSGWGQGPHQAYLDDQTFDSLQHPDYYSVDPAFGEYKGEWQLQYSGGYAPLRGGVYFLKDLGGTNTTSYDLFLPENTADEKKSVYYHLKDVPGITTIQGPYGNRTTGVTTTGNAIPGLWLGPDNLLRNDVTTAGDTYGGGGIHCWQSSGDWNYYGASPTQPSDCPSGWINAGVASTFVQGVNGTTSNRYNYNPNNYNPDYNYDYGGTGYFRDSRGYGWNDYYTSSASSYPWTQLIPEMLSKHDQSSAYGKQDPFQYGSYQSSMFWAWLTGRAGTNHPTTTISGYQSNPFGCNASFPFFALAVRKCYKAYYNVI